MSGLGNLPENPVRQGFELYQSFVKNAPKDSKGNAKIKDIFLIQTGKGLEVVQKKSARALVFGAIKRVKQLFGKDDSSFHAQKNLTVAAKLLSQAAGADNKYYEELALELRARGRDIDPIALRKHLEELSRNLSALQGHINQKRIQPITNVHFASSVPEKVSGISKKYHFGSIEEYRTKATELLQHVLGQDVTSDTLQVVVSVLYTSERRDALLHSFEELAKENPPSASTLKGCQEGLQLELLKALARVTDERSVKIQRALDSLRPSMPTGLPDPRKLKHFAMVFGDSFIKKSGFEGEETSTPFASMLSDFIQTQKQGSNSVKLQALDFTLKNAIDLRSIKPGEHDKLEESIKENLKKCPGEPKRCILFGGWDKHALVYEVELLKNGKYAFRVYNEGDGSQKADTLNDGSKQKHSACIGTREIPEKLLFQKTFLNSLQAMTKLPKKTDVGVKADELIINHILPMLDGKEERFDPAIDRFLSTQRSGTCCYRSLLAFISKTMTQEEYKLFKFNLKMHLLNQYLPELRGATNLPISNEIGYDEARLRYNTIKHAIEKFAGGIKKLERSLPENKVKEAQAFIIEYNAQLRLFEKQLEAYEKSLFAKNVQELKAEPAHGALPEAAILIGSVDADAASNRPFENAATIKSLSVDDLEKSLAAISKLLPETRWLNNPDGGFDIRQTGGEQFLIAAYSFMQNAQSIHAFDSLAAQDAKKSFEVLNQICTTLALSIKRGNLAEHAERRAMLYFYSYGLQKAFDSLNDSDRLLPSQAHALFLPNKAIEEFCTQDPVCANIFQEIGQLAAKTRANDVLFHNVAFNEYVRKEDKRVELSDTLVHAIMEWYNAPDNELRKDVEAYRQAETAKKGDKKEPQENTPEAIVNRAYRELQAGNFSYNQLKQRWPESFLNGTLTNRQMAEVLLFKRAPQMVEQSPVLPQPLVDFCNMSLLMNNILNKSREDIGTGSTFDNKHLPMDHIRWDAARGAPILQASQAYYLMVKPLENDVYLPCIRDKNTAFLYRQLFLARHEEAKIPYVVARLQQFPEQAAEHLEPDEIREFFAIRSNKSVQLEATLAYFQEHQERLRDPDWMNIFQALLFEGNLLLAETQSPQRRALFLQKASIFLNEGIQNALLLDEVSSAANLYYIASKIQDYAPDAAPIVDPSVAFQIAEKAIKPEFTNKRPEVFEALLASSERSFQTASQTELEKKQFALGLLSHFVLTDNPPNDAVRSPLRQERAKRTQEFLKVLLSAPSDLRKEDVAVILNQHLGPYLRMLLPNLNAASIAAVSLNEYKAGAVTISLIAGKIRSNQVEASLTYSSNPTSDTLNTLRAWGFYKDSDDLSHLRSSSTQGIVYIHDAKLGRTFAIKNNSEVFLKDSGNIWRAVVGLNQRSAYVKSANLISKYHHLYVDNGILLVDPATLKTVYKVTFQDGKSVLQTVDEPRLTLGYPPDGGPFASFEATEHTEYWTNEKNEVQKIAFGRLKLTLVIDPDNPKRWLVQEQRRWHIATEQFLPNFGQSTGFLLLENAQGAKKALLPIWDPVGDKKEKRALNFPYKYSFKEEEGIPARYAEYDVKDQQLIPKKAEALFYLARIYLEKDCAQEALALLASPRVEITSRVLTQSERSILRSIVTQPYSRNISSPTLMARLRALYLLEKNLATSAEVDPIFSKLENLKMKANYLYDYQSRASHIPPMGQAQELFLYNRVVDALASEIVELELKLQEAVSPLSEIEESKIKNEIAELDKVKGQLVVRQSELSGDFDLISTVKTTKTVDRAQFLSSDDSHESVLNRLGIKQDEMSTAEQKLAYKAARKEGRLPFDPLKATAADMKQYFLLLEKEVLSGPSYSQARDSGLIQALYYMATFSQDPNVSSASRYLIRTLQEGTSIVDVLCRYIFSSSFVPSRLFKTYTVPMTKESVDLRAPLSTIGLFGIDTCMRAKVLDLQELSKSYLMQVEGAAVETGNVKTLFSESCPEAKDAATKKQFKNAAQDLKEAERLPKPTNYALIDGSHVGELYVSLKNRSQDAEKILAEQKEIILSSLHSALQASESSYLNVLSGKRELPTIEKMAVLAARQDFLQITQKLYPELSKEALITLQNALKEYLVQKQAVQQIKRAERLAENCRDPETLNQLGRELNSTRAYKLNDPQSMAFLLLETMQDITLRRDQIDNLKKIFLATKVENKSVVIQMIMGAGKTSVLQPMLAILLASPDTLSTVMVPEALFEPVRAALAAVLGDAFETLVFHLPYERDRAQETSYLKSFYDHLVEAKGRGSCLLLTPQEKYSILTSRDEAYYIATHNPSKEADERLESIVKICQFLELNEIDQIDEIDTIMDAKVIFKYPIGNREGVNTERATLVSSLVTRLASDPEITSKVSLDFANRLYERTTGEKAKTLPPLTKELYTSVVKPRLAAIALELLGSRFADLQKQDTHNYLVSFLTKSTPFDDDIQAKFLPTEELDALRQLPQEEKELFKLANSGSKNAPLAARELYMRQRDAWIKNEIPNNEERQALGALSKAISKTLPVSLFSECGTRYGADLRAGRHVAKPYAAAGSPKTTQYSDVYEQVIYSTQLAIYSGIPKASTLKMLEKLQDDAKIEMHKNSISLDQTESYKLFLNAIGPEKASQFSFLSKPITEALLAEFHKSVSSKPEWILRYLKEAVYPQCGFNKESLTCTPQGLPGSSKNVTGYTGTMQEASLSRAMNPLPEKGTNGKTISAVEGKQPLVVTLSTAESFGQQVVTRFCEDRELFVFTDSGGWLKDEKIEDFAEKMLLSVEKTRPDIKGIVYHNAQGEIMALERTGAGSLRRVPLSESSYSTAKGEMLTVIQQKYETGTNIPQLPTAKCFLSIRKNMSLRDVLQAIFRMRKILEGQKIIFGLSEEVTMSMSNALVESLLSNASLRQLLSNPFDLAAIDVVLDGLNLEPELTHNLKKAFRCLANDKTLVEKFQSGCLIPRALMLEFMGAFHQSFDPNSKTLWRYFVANQARVDQEQSWQAGRQRMREVLEKPLRSILNDTSIPIEERKKLSQIVEKLTILKEDDTPFEEMMAGSRLLSAKAAITAEVDRYLSIWSELERAKINPELLAKIDAQVFSLYGRVKSEQTSFDRIQEVLHTCIKEDEIAEVIEMSKIGEGSEIEQEQEQEKQSEAERELESHSQPKKPSKKSYKPLVPVEKGKGYKVENFFSAKLPPLQPLLPRTVRMKYMDQLYFSPNLFLDQGKLGSDNQGLYQLPGRFLLAISEPNKPTKYMLASHEDAALIKEGIYNSPVKPPRMLALFSFDGEVVASTNGDLVQERLQTREHREVLVQAKILTGRIDISDVEAKLIQNLYTAEEAKSVKGLIENILQYKPAAGKRYVGGNLNLALQKASVAA